MKKYKWYIVLLGIIAILIIALNISLHRIKDLKSNDGKIIRDTTIVIKYDTITIRKPVYISQKLVDTVFKTIGDTLRLNDTLYLPIEIIQKEYKKDSLYRVLVSGYQPSLDLIEVYPKTIYQNITNTVYKKPAKISFGIMGGYGLQYYKHQINFGPTISVGIYYKF